MSFRLFFYFVYLIHFVLCIDQYQQKMGVPNCQQQCNLNQQCLKKCEIVKQESTKKMIIITLSVLSFFLVACVCCLLCSHPKFRKFRLILNKKYKLIKKINSQVDDKVMSRDQFICHLNTIVELFNQSQTKNNFISFKEGSEFLSKVIVTAVQSQPFLYDIQLKGQDDVGGWSGSGNISCTHEGVICWFVKEYDEVYWKDKQNKGKFLYKSEPSTMGNLQGVWYNIQKDKNDPIQNQWKLQKTKNMVFHEQISDHKILS